MKILVIGPSPVRSKGGMATVIEEIVKDKKLNEEFEIDVYESYIDGNKLKVLLFSVISFIRFYFTKRNYDIYHIHAASYGSTFRKGWYVYAAKKWGKKVILHIHGAAFMDFYAHLSETKKKKVIQILDAADMVIALSEEWKRKFEQTFVLKKCNVLENGIDDEKLKECITPIAACKENFLLLGRLGERKGAYDLVNAVEMAVRQNPKIKLYMAGDGEIDKVKAFVAAKKLENNIDVVGWVNFQGKKELLKKVSTVVLPSYNEGLPMSILEGMATGKAIISTTVGAIPEVVSKENGILIQAGDVPALAEALLQCSIDTEMIERMGRANISKINEKFSMRKMHKLLGQYYDLMGSQ